MDRVCPLLALAADHRTVVDGVDAGHRCHATAEPLPLERQQQAQLCLTPRHDHCERYLQHVARRGAVPGGMSLGDGLVTTRMRLAPEPAWRGIAGRARTARPGRAAGIGAGLLAAGIATTALAGPALNGELTILNAAVAVTPTPSSAPAAAPAVSATPTVVASPTPASTPTPEPTLEPTSEPAVAPTPTPTIAPSPAPPTPASTRTYVVQAGDTLAQIAQNFGTTVQVLQAANGIEDPDEIVLGSVLVIP